jgi:hypothetical protein
VAVGAIGFAHGLRASAGINGIGFTAGVTNPWFPLRPGTAYVYTGIKDGKPSRDVVIVTHKMQVIDGVPCVAVQDRLYIRGRLFERTTDSYTQDSQGNVWYLGEETAELDTDGHVTSTEGSWQAGANSARPGILMPAEPHVGQSFRQEFYSGHAEDHFQIIGIQATVTPPHAQATLLTKEWTPLEPGVIDHKRYVHSIGTVAEQTVKGGSERTEMISMRTGS